MKSAKNITKFTSALEPYNGYSNHVTWQTAHYISNDEHLYDLCKQFYDSGYTSWGSMVCKLKEYGKTWQSMNNANEVRWGDSNIKAREMTELLHSLFSKPNEKKSNRTKQQNPPPRVD